MNINQQGTQAPYTPPTGTLPRALSESLLWTGGIVDVQYGESTVHAHFGAFLLRGSRTSVLIDTGHAMHWQTIERDVETFLKGRPLDYVFLTHGEFPHAGLLPQWMHKYPDAIAVGDIADYRMYFPEFSDRIRPMTAGDRLDLGDRSLLFVPAVWKDLPRTLWAFDTKDRTLFVSDGFAYLHFHELGQSDMLASEMPAPDAKMIQFYNERALHWTKFTDAETTFGDLDALIGMLEPRLLAPAHGNVIDTKEDMIPRFKWALARGDAEDFTLPGASRGTI